jgi:hypothetical protein
MAKVQAKKAATPAKKSVAKNAAARPKSAPAKKKAPAKPSKSVSKAKPSKPAAKAVKPVKSKPTKAAKPAKATRSAKPAKAAKAVKTSKPAKPAKAAAKHGATGKRVAKTADTVVKVAAVAAAIPVAAKAAKAIAGSDASDKKRTRRPRTRLQSTGAAVANWFVQDKPRPSSFIPAPPRAEAPSLVAAPPASSDRLIRPEDLAHTAVRTVPVRIDVEQGGGRVFLSVSPIEVTLRPAEGIEWDFRYLGGADVIIDELIIEFDRPSPFGMATFRSKRPGAARPHRQLSGGASNSSAGKRFQYTIRAMNAFKTELATARPSVHILLA